jgi:hypothetical protein
MWSVFYNRNNYCRVGFIWFILGIFVVAGGSYIKQTNQIENADKISSASDFVGFIIIGFGSLFLYISSNKGFQNFQRYCLSRFHSSTTLPPSPSFSSSVPVFGSSSTIPHSLRIVDSSSSSSVQGMDFQSSLTLLQNPSEPVTEDTLCTILTVIIRTGENNLQLEELNNDSKERSNLRTKLIDIAKHTRNNYPNAWSPQVAEKYRVILTLLR